MNWRKMKIVAAAILDHGTVYTLPSPASHDDILAKLVKDGFRPDGDTELGFVTDTGDFVRRVAACMIARNAGQLEGRTKTGPEDALFSEDLW